MKYLLIIFSLLVFSNLMASTPLELSKLAEERAPLIKVQLEGLRANEHDVSQSKILGNPILTYQGGQLRSQGTKGQVTDITLMQPLPWPGKRSAGIKTSEFLQKIAKLNVEESKIELAHQVYLLSYELASETEIENHNTERRNRYALILKYLNTRPLASPKQILEKDLIYSQLRIAEKTMNESSAKKRSLEGVLKILTGLAEVKVKADWENLPRPHEKQFYLSEYESGFKVRKMREELKISENKIESARLAARPDIMVGVNYREENVEPSNHFYHGQVSVVIPIVDRGQHAVQSARAQLRRSEAQLKLLDQDIQTKLEFSYENLIAARKNLDIFPLSLFKQSESRFEKAEVAFRKGQIDVMTFLQSDTQVHENIHQIYLSRLEYLSTLSQLEQLVSHYMERE